MQIQQFTAGEKYQVLNARTLYDVAECFPEIEFTMNALQTDLRHYMCIWILCIKYSYFQNASIEHLIMNVRDRSYDVTRIIEEWAWSIPRKIAKVLVQERGCINLFKVLSTLCLSSFRASKHIKPTRRKSGWYKTPRLPPFGSVFADSRISRVSAKGNGCSLKPLVSLPLPQSSLIRTNLL